MEEVESSFKPAHEEACEEITEHGERWIAWCAVISAILAVCAAVAGLSAGHYANEALLDQIKSSDQYGYYQAKGIKGAIAELQGDAAKVAHYKADQEAIQRQAEAFTASAERKLKRHESLASSVTLFQIGIALIAISVLTRQKHFLWAVLALGLGGLYFVGQSFLLF